MSKLNDDLIGTGDDLANALAQILDVYEISPRLGKTAANRALRQWKKMRTQMAKAEGDRAPGEMPCPATGAEHEITATPTRWFNRCEQCGEAWAG